MNVTMPAPAPAGPPAAAPNDRVIGREHPTTSPTKNSTGPQADDERTFEEQLDDVAVALARTTPPAPIEAHTKQRPNPDPTTTTATTATTATTSTTVGAAVAAVAAFAPPTTVVVATPALSTSAGAAVALPAVAIATAPVAMAPAITEVGGTSTPITPALETTDPAALANVAAEASEMQALATPAPAPTDDIPATIGTPFAAPTADAATRPAPLPSLTVPGNIQPITAPSGGQVPATAQTALAAAVQAAAGATIDAVTDTDTTDGDTTTVADADGAGPAVTDTTTQPAFAIHTTAARRDASPTPTGGPAPVITESADDLAMPARLAPPRTIAVDLNDEGLGPLRVIATSEQRTVHLTVSASEAVVREALVRQQADLRHDLADAGLQLGSFEVDSRAADRDQANPPTVSGDRDRPSIRSAGALPATAPIPSTHDADGRLDLRL